VEKQLFTCGKHKLIAAIYALEDSIGKFHGRLPRSREEESARTLENSPVPFPCLRTIHKQGPGPHKNGGEIGVSAQGDITTGSTGTAGARKSLSSAPCALEFLSTIARGVRVNRLIANPERLFAAPDDFFSPALYEPSCDSACAPVQP
jgi:hypothetical protein